MSIRLMEATDVPIVAAIEEQLFSSTWAKEDFYHELFNNPFARYYVLEDDQLIKGYIGLWLMGDQCQITTIGVSCDEQGHGYGSQLIEKAIQKSLELHYKNVNLEVRVSNRKAIALYQKYEFKNVAVRKNYYENHEDAYLMIKELEG